jgi:hypothetical protein
MFQDLENIGKDTLFVSVACLFIEISAKHDFSIMAAANLHMFGHCTISITYKCLNRIPWPWKHRFKHIIDLFAFLCLMILHKLIKKSDQIVNCAAILLCKLEHQKLKISLGNRVYRFQHTWIMLKSLVPNFYPKMPLAFTISPNPSSL